MTILLVKDLTSKRTKNKLDKGTILEVEENHRKKRKYLVKNNHVYWFVGYSEAKPVK
jgi:hypothetical protein